nr:hypothetical protein [Tanacetum cinerariifolium]
MATESNDVRRSTLRRLREELVADVALGNNLLLVLNRYLYQMRNSGPEMFRVESLPDHPLINDMSCIVKTTSSEPKLGKETRVTASMATSLYTSIAWVSCQQWDVLLRWCTLATDSTKTCLNDNEKRKLDNDLRKIASCAQMMELMSMLKQLDVSTSSKVCYDMDESVDRESERGKGVGIASRQLGLLQYDAPINTTPIDEIAATGWEEEFSDDEVTRAEFSDNEVTPGKIKSVATDKWPETDIKWLEQQQEFLEETTTIELLKQL